MAWESLTAAEVLALFNDSETTAYNTAKGDDAGAALPQAITFVVNELREAIAGRDIILGPDGTLPSGFKKKAIGAVRYEFLNALPTGKSLLTEERVKANAAFEKLVEDIQAGKIKIVDGLGSTALALPAIKANHRQMKRHAQDGL